MTQNLHKNIKREYTGMHMTRQLESILIVAVFSEHGERVYCLIILGILYSINVNYFLSIVFVAL